MAEIKTTVINITVPAKIIFSEDKCDTDCEMYHIQGFDDYCIRYDEYLCSSEGEEGTVQHRCSECIEEFGIYGEKQNGN